jgi:hypothetical protein
VESGGETWNESELLTDSVDDSRLQSPRPFKERESKNAVPRDFDFMRTFIINQLSSIFYLLMRKKQRQVMYKIARNYDANVKYSKQIQHVLTKMDF